ncbi:energy transducer TonB family protein [Alloalcanivorax marinus]|uniref:energy transducer TonB family protein n=1 Tax=Alloalcanivorax marinus TaxID=1177169 RepID=UPI0019579EFD|nr:energy transducer TonB [Alloalcanivorax marinus]MBM7332451.1 TonB family protein [Alloalcanivorax marinus]
MNDLSRPGPSQAPLAPVAPPPDLPGAAAGPRLSEDTRRWLSSTLLVTLVYAAPLGWWLWRAPPPALDSAPAAAMVVELAPLATSPATPTELPPGPESQASQAARAAPPERRPETQPEPKPEPAPPPAPAEPEVTLPEAELQPEQKEPQRRQKELQPEPKEPQPEQQAPQPDPTPEPPPTEQAAESPSPEKASRNAAASTASAPPDAARQSERAAAPRQGVQRPRADLNQVPSWRDTLLRRLNEAKRYPSRARRLRQEGVGYLRFEMDMEGRVLASGIARSSGYPLLDEETLALLRRAAPLPRPPKELAGQRLEFVVPVEFFLSTGR